MPGNKDKISECACSKCSVYKTQLKDALEELESARMIIDVLQTELLTTPTTKNACGTGSVSVQEYNKQGKTKEWTLVSSKNNSIKPNKNNECEFISPNQPIMTTIRFTLLSNLQTNDEDSSGTQEREKQISTQSMNGTTNQHRIGMKIPTIVGGKIKDSGNPKTTPTKKKTACTPGTSINNKEHKVRILGDSHLRGTATKIDQNLNTKF